MKTIWRDDDYYKLLPLTDKAVEDAEEKLKVKLPESYINLLKEQNGGYINYNSFPSSVPTSWAEDHIHIDHILGVGEEDGILQSEYLIKEWGLPTNIVLFSGEGLSSKGVEEMVSIIRKDKEIEYYADMYFDEN